jgi:hypothetical protein
VAEIRTLVLVEGDSDAAAVRALAAILGCDLGLLHIQICSAGGVTNFSQSLAGFVRMHPNAQFCGMYDLAEERHVRRALASASVPIAPHESLEPFGFFACVADLEEELIRALGAEAVERVLEAQGELVSSTLPGDAAAPPHAHGSTAAPIPRHACDAENPVRTASGRSPRPWPVAAPAGATGSQAACGRDGRAHPLYRGDVPKPASRALGRASCQTFGALELAQMAHTQ